MTLCIAAACQDKGKSRIVIATDWKASTGMAGAEIQDKLYWVGDNIAVLVAGTVSRASELVNTYAQYFEGLPQPPQIKPSNLSDFVRRPVLLFKAKLVDEYTALKYGLTYKGFRNAVAKKEIPQSIASETYADIKKINLDCCLILTTFLGRDPYIFRVDDDGSIEDCDNFTAIGSGSPIAEGVLYQREQQDGMPLGRTVYHVYEAMKLGSIASDVGDEHTIDVLYPPGTNGKKAVWGENQTEKADKFLERQFAKLGPKKFAKMPLPDGFWEPDFE